ncbi:hypothetical protein Moror_8196 [Moniliophthora roreri MCA 2997]|uniref:Uncharacterized protein n=2 Tax=Moniliophthora roreri TaxID=221103 RepID=V2XNA4_MONRO|nr:hypothetical protein Moror_8196 [Moniliophthora roreri MCA 2997]
MFIPLISSRQDTKKLYRRKGGGGGGRGGGSRGGKTGGSKSSGSKSSSSTTWTSSSSGPGRTKSSTFYGGSRSMSSYGGGGGSAGFVPAGQLFAGRAMGGGSREQAFGTRMYGSGYPGVTGRGVAGRGFPFFFWPVVWGSAAGVGLGTAAYLHNDEYGLPSNTSRPGGPQMTAAFQSNATSTILRVVADNDTTIELITVLNQNCSQYFTSNSAKNMQDAKPFNVSAFDAPKPEQVIQYYRASTVALTMDGYNNSQAVWSTSETGVVDAPLPSGIDLRMLDCVNQTIGVGVPLINGASSSFVMGNGGFSLVGMIWMVLLWTLM